MSTLLPYFKWFPADVQTDAAYKAMSSAERGLYRDCLDMAWINDGLPIDPLQIARIIGMGLDEFRDLWVNVADMFHEVDGKLRNVRQEAERAEAVKKSKTATDAAKLRYERTASAVRTQSERKAGAVPRAYDSLSISESFSSEEKKTSLREVPKGLPDPGCQDFSVRFDRLYIAHPKTGFEFEARSRYVEIVASAVMPDATADSIDKSHGIWLEFWRKNPAEFVPSLSKWFEDKYYVKQPMARDPPKRHRSIDELADQAMAELEAEKAEAAERARLRANR